MSSINRSRWHRKFVWYATTIDEGVVICSTCWARFVDRSVPYWLIFHWEYSITKPKDVTTSDSPEVEAS